MGFEVVTNNVVSHARGVSESQFDQVLNIELDLYIMIEACKFLTLFDMLE
jgi:hypothetical protein